MVVYQKWQIWGVRRSTLTCKQFEKGILLQIYMFTPWTHVVVFPWQRICQPPKVSFDSCFTATTLKICFRYISTLSLDSWSDFIWRTFKICKKGIWGIWSRRPPPVHAPLSQSLVRGSERGLDGKPPKLPASALRLTEGKSAGGGLFGGTKAPPLPLLKSANTLMLIWPFFCQLRFAKPMWWTKGRKQDHQR